MMKFDEWTTEARSSLQEWNPEPAVPPTAPATRRDGDDLVPVDPVATAVCVEPSTARGRQPASTRRRLLSAAAAIVVVAAAAALVAAVVAPADTDVASGPPTAPTPAAGERSATALPLDPGSGPDAPRFDCVAADPQKGAPTEVLDRSADVAEWRAVGVDGLRPGTGSQSAASASPGYVTGTLTESPGEGVTTTATRAAAFVAALDPGWSCTVESPMVDVADPSRPGPIVDESNTVTNRLGGRCLVPDGSAAEGSVWGLDPSLAAALDDVDGLTGWSVVLADGGHNDQGPGRLWMEFVFEADPNANDREATTRLLAEVSAAVGRAGASAGVATECSVH